MSRSKVSALAGFLTLTLSVLAGSANAQPRNAPNPQTTVKFKFADISVPGAVQTSAYAINNKKFVAGNYLDDAGEQKAMIFKGSKLTSVSCPSGAATSFYGVNSGGSAVADDTCGNGFSWVYVPGRGWVPIPDPGCPDCPIFSLAINDIDQVVGIEIDENQVARGFSYNLKSNNFTTWKMPGYPLPVPAFWGINNEGVVALQALDPASGLAHSYLFNGSSFTQIDVPGALQSFAHGINNNGDIVYTVEDANGNSSGVLYYLGQFYWFNQPDGRHTTRAYGITDEVKTENGIKLKIVGDYTVPGSNQDKAFEATVVIR